MSYNSLLTDRCDLYHLNPSGGQSSHGVPIKGSPKYGNIPDVVSAPCYWSSGSHGNITRQEPHYELSETFLVHFPLSVDVRLHDKAVFNGVTYKLLNPRKVKNHHQEVTAYRDGEI